MRPYEGLEDKTQLYWGPNSAPSDDFIKEHVNRPCEGTSEVTPPPLVVPLFRDHM